MKSIRVGLIGAGQIAYNHCREINAHPEAQVVAVADPSRERADRIASEFGIEGVYASAGELLKKAQVDAVSIAVPTAYHAPIAIEALRAGCHVMLDKPFAMNAAEAARVIRAARDARRVFTVGMNQRFNKEAQTVKALVERGELGEIYHAKAFWLRRAGIPKLGTWFGSRKLAGGGCTLDIGVHMLDVCLYLMDNFKPVSVSATTRTVFGNRGLGEGGWGQSDRIKKGFVFDVEDFTAALIRMRNGATVQLEVAWAMHQETGNRNNVELFGTEAGASTFPARLFRFGAKPGEYEVVEPQGVKGPYAGTNRFANWIDTILRRAQPCVTPAQALVVQKTLDAIFRSARQRRDVKVE